MDNNDDVKPPRPFTRRHLLKSAAIGAAALALPRADAATPHASSEAALPPMPADKIAPAAPAKAVPFDLGDVRLLPGPFQDAQARDGAYLLSLEPDRLLHNFRTAAGLPPKGEPYGGWERQGLAGHSTGHYLSACALMYRATGDARYRQRADYVVGDLAACQAQAPDGFVCGIPDGKGIFAKIAADGTVMGWAPWYTMHKLYAGLRDTYKYCGNAQARSVFLRLTDWALATTQNLTDAQFQHMLDTEHGGIVETVSDAYAMTGDSKYLAFARRFTHHAVFDPLAARQDRLDGLHSNTNIPKMVGYERLYELTGDAPYHTAPEFFWQTVVNTRSYANGGNGDYEHFFPVSEFKNHVHSDTATETCCTYNMLKLTKGQFTQDPSAAYAEYYERAVLNNILASQEAEQGLMAYHTPMKPGHFKVYGDPVNAFWCCTGTGMENHARYGEAIYFHGADGRALYVNLFLPSTLRWREKGLTLRQDTRWPEGDTTRLTLACAKPTAFALKLRRPSWAPGMTVRVNGKPVPATPAPDGYVTVSRTWHTGDVVDAQFPMGIRTEILPNTPGKQAVFYGPVLLAGALGTEGMMPGMDVQNNQAPFDRKSALAVAAFVAPAGAVPGHVKPVTGAAPLTFRTEGLGKPDDVTLIPLYRLNHERYNLYWSVYTPEEFAQHQAAEAAQDALTLDRFLPGSRQSDLEHGLQSRGSHTGVLDGASWRDATDGGEFSFTLKGDPAAPLVLRCTYWGGDSGGREFDLLVNGTVVATQKLNNNKPGQFFDVDSPLPATLTRGKSSLTITLRAKPGRIAGGLFACRLMRAPVA